MIVIIIITWTLMAINVHVKTILSSNLTRRIKKPSVKWKSRAKRQNYTFLAIIPANPVKRTHNQRAVRTRRALVLMVLRKKMICASPRSPAVPKITTSRTTSAYRARLAQNLLVAIQQNVRAPTVPRGPTASATKISKTTISKRTNQGLTPSPSSSQSFWFSSPSF